MITLPLKSAALGSTLKFAEIGRGHLFEAEAQFSGQLGHVPEHIPKLQAHIFGEALVHNTSTIADQFFDFVGDFTGLTGQAKGWIDEIISGIGVSGRAAGLKLVVVEKHGESSEG
tara:strand:- start:1051 stop:1395 length:345 start_codon:yes stop_codon:yes gene_type:complete